MNRSKLCCIVAAACVASTAAQAAWKGKGEAGLVFARGNTQTDSINLKLEMSKEVDRWKHALDMSALRATTAGLATAKRYQAGWQSNYQFSDRGFYFGGLRYEQDEFSGFDYQASATTGYGYKFIDTERTKFSGQAGAGYRRSKLKPTGATESNAIFQAGPFRTPPMNAITTAASSPETIEAMTSPTSPSS